MKLIRKTSAVLLAVAIIFGQISFAGIDLKLEGKPLTLNHKIEPEKIANTLMVPLRDTFEALGATVTYDSKSKKIEMKKGATTADFVLGQATFRVNGKKLTMDQGITSKKGRALVPAHVLEQVFGVKMTLQGNSLLMENSKKEPFRVSTINGPTGVAMAQLIDNSYLGENADMAYEVVSNPQLLPAKLLKGETDIAFMPTNMASVVYNKSKGQVVLISTDIWGLLSVVTTDPAIKTWSDLKGKQIDIFGQGSTPEIAFKALLEANGLNPKTDVTYKFSYDAPATLATALAANQVKDGIAVIAEPFTSLAESKNKSVRVALEFKDEWKKANGGLGFPMSSIVVRKEFLEKHPELVRSFMREFKSDIAFMNQNPKAVAVLADKQPELQFASNLLEVAIPRSDYKFQTAAEAKMAIAQYLKVLFEFDPQTIGGKMPGDDFYADVTYDY